MRVGGLPGPDAPRDCALLGAVPTPVQGFVGRDVELARIENLLLNDGVRLVTIVGLGGIGKTSLAAEAVRRFSARFDDDRQVCWVRLARLPAGAGTEDVERETAAALVRYGFPAGTMWESLVDDLAWVEAGQRPVVVLDNCEHVLDGVRQLVSDLLAAVGDLRIVATSRSPIGWVDEHLIRTPPLAAGQALTLFRDRAELRGRPLDGEGQFRLAAEICRRVDRVPLLVKLAAARLSRQPLAVIHGELTGRCDDDRRLGWFTSAPGGVEQRHLGITNVIAWSYGLCSLKEQVLFDRLSVFAASDPVEGGADVGADLDAIITICADARGPDSADNRAAVFPEEVEDLLERLADHSLVNLHFTHKSVQYSLLETARMFAGQRLRERGADQVRRLSSRHLRYYRDRVCEAAACWFGPAEQELLDWARAAWANLLTAVETSLSVPGQAQAGLEICVALISLRMPFLRGSMREIASWTERCLAATQWPDQPADLQVLARAALAWIAVRQGRAGDADAMLDRCVAACRPDLADQADWRDSDADLGLPAPVDLAWGTQLFMADRDPRAVAVLLRSRDKSYSVGDDGAAMMAGMFAGMAAALLGTAQQAHDIAGRCLAEARASGAAWAISWSELSWAISLIKAGNPSEATSVLHHALQHQLAVGDQWGAAWSIELRTWALASALTSARQAAHQVDMTSIATDIAHLAGGTIALRARLGINIEAMGRFADESRRACEAAQRVLGREVYSAEVLLGTQLQLDANEVHRLALGQLALSNRTIAPWDTLTPAEQAVATLAAAGLSNTQIAKRRAVAPSTIANQVVAILKKLDIDSRHLITTKAPPGVEKEIKTMRGQLAAPDRQRSQHEVPDQRRAIARSQASHRPGGGGLREMVTPLDGAATGR